MLMLVDRDESDNQLLNKVIFPAMEQDRSWGRYPNATGDFEALQGTPGESNGGGGGPVFRRGDVNDDVNVDISDAVRVLAYLFGGVETPSCVDSGDTNDDGASNITDAIFLLEFLYRGGSAPPAPFPEMGADPGEADALGCEDGLDPFGG